MPLFQVSARSVQPSGLPNKRPRRVQRWWYYVLLRLTVGALIITALVTLLSRVGLIALFFILLPVIVTFINALFSRYNRNRLLLTIGLAFVYFGGITWWELFTHRPGTSELIVVTTTLAMAVLFEPARTYVQSFLEQRYRLRDTV
ncbi:MAG TPA: hypothetical protein VEL31_05295 [Ktedonobacteraceae bacterium]|nr:hypothetical protein [Ktedonobacteraceae bacterium]